MRRLHRPGYRDGSDRRPAPSEVATSWNVLDRRQQAQRLKGHLLGIMGGLDDNVPPGSVRHVMDALMKVAKDVDFIGLPNPPHSLRAFAPYVNRRRWDADDAASEVLSRLPRDAKPPMHFARQPGEAPAEACRRAALRIPPAKAAKVLPASMAHGVSAWNDWRTDACNDWRNDLRYASSPGPGAHVHDLTCQTRSNELWGSAT